MTCRLLSCVVCVGGKIKCITVCENSHAIASGSDNSSIHVIKVEYTTKKEGQVNRYTGVSTVQYLDKVQGPVVAIDHFNTDSQSVLIYATGTHHRPSRGSARAPCCAAFAQC